MANAVRGEVGFSLQGEAYILVLDFNALCDLEDDLPGLMAGEAEIKSPSAIRAVFHAALQARHPQIDVRGAGALIHELGLERAGELIKEAFAASYPTPASGGKGAARPRTAKSRPGAGSAP